jgi:general stress protein YciG
MSSTILCLITTLFSFFLLSFYTFKHSLIRQPFCGSLSFLSLLKFWVMANQSNRGNKSDRGLASADKETRERVAREGGKASGGGKSDRGLASADKETRERVAREGGKASGGDR